MSSDTTTVSPFEHAERGDVDYFQSVEINVLKNYRGEIGHSLLSFAAMYGELSCCQVIYRRCPQLLYERNYDGFTPLHDAAYNGRNEVIKYLLTARATLEQDAKGINIGVEGGVVETILIDEELLMMVNDRKQTALHWAAHYCDLESVKLLLEADRSKKLLGMVDKYKRTALHNAVEYLRLEIVEVLVEADPDFEYSVDISGQTPLFIAWKEALTGDQKQVEIRNFLIQRQSNQCAVRTGPNGWTILHHAACEGDLSAVKEIIRSNRSWSELLRMTDNSKSTALHVAVKFKHLEIVEVLVEADPDFEYSADDQGNTPLFIAWEEASSGDERAVEIRNFLIQRQSSTTLHFAVKNHHLEIVELLVEAHPDFEYSANNDGQTPLLIALIEAVSRDPKTVKIRSYLIDKQSRQCMVPTGQKDWTLLHHAASKQEFGAMEEIIQSCPDCLAVVDKKGQNFLHLAVSSKHIDVVNYILGNPKIDDSVLNGRDKNGDTPLHLATAGGSVSISLSLLYDSRVRKMIQNNNGKSALDAIDFVYDLSRAKVEGLPGLVDLKQLKDRSDFDLLVGALIATVSFTAGITVPGGFFSDGPSRGNAVLYKKRTFEAFVVFNTIALSLSLFVVLSHFCLRRLVNKKNILLQLQMATFSLMGAILAMMVAFIMGSFAVLSISPGLSITVCLICCCFFGASGYCIWMMIGDKVKQTGRSS